MRGPSRALVLASLVALPATGLLEAQEHDRFGQVVAVDGSDVLVLKPLAGRGPAALYAYRPGAGGWQTVDRLPPTDAGETAEGYSASLTLDGDRLWIGSGDASVRWAAHVLRRAGSRWTRGERLALDPTRPPAPAPATLDLAGLMRIIQPPLRVVTLDGERALVAVVGAGVPAVRVLEANRDGTWSVAASLETTAARPDDRFGAALALDGDLAFVGAPLQGNAGAVFVFRRSADTGTWVLAQTLRLAGDGAAANARFGSSLLLEGGTLAVGAPGAGVVVFFERQGGGDAWVETARLASPEGGGDGFGTALAVGPDELWVGAPSGAEARGTVHRYRREGGSAAWRPAAGGPLTGPTEDSDFGESVALGERVAVVGSPGADGDVGRAAVFPRRPDGRWGEPVWLRPGEELTAVTGGEVPCRDGRAGGFACDHVDLLSFLPVTALGGAPGETVSDVWGWTDPVADREYALVGRTGGAALVDVTDPANPRYRGVVRANPSGARDLKVYRDHLFFTGDGAGNHGLVIFDLTRLRGVTEPVDFEPDTVYHGIASAHNLVVDTEAGFAYPVGASGGGRTCGGGLHMLDIREPERPVFAGCYTDTEGLIWQGRTHDAQCVVYHGPDSSYRGHEVCFASNETALRIVDVTDKAEPVPLSVARYPDQAYVHQGWLTEDQRYFYMDDELDELTGQAPRTRTLVWDVAELEDPIFVGAFFGPTPATDHNLFIRGNRMYQANYNAGMWVWDVSEPEHPVPIGHFDTTPWEGDPPGFFGAWTAFPFFDSGTVVVTSIDEGLFVLRPRAVFP